MVRLMDDRVFVEGFVDVLSINDCVIQFLYKGYTITFEGKDFVVAAFSKNEMIFFGVIHNVSFQYLHD